mmetsp:Transcript_81723/g.179592  ORF Transcript_81723/g.179592 Transcript_81723/m.179592 type:complete len:260 (-) Transcript_81723:55-834(-)
MHSGQCRSSKVVPPKAGAAASLLALVLAIAVAPEVALGAVVSTFADADDARGSGSGGAGGGWGSSQLRHGGLAGAGHLKKMHVRPQPEAKLSKGNNETTVDVVKPGQAQNESAADSSSSEAAEVQLIPGAPDKKAFVSKCRKHVGKLVEAIDRDHTDLQLESVLSSYCKTASDSEHGFKTDEDCEFFAKRLMAAREHELRTNGTGKYWTLCEDFFFHKFEDKTYMKEEEEKVDRSGGFIPYLVWIPSLYMGLMWFLLCV